jgi:thioredoxin 1
MSILLYSVLGIALVFLAIRFALVMSMRRKEGRAAPDLDGKMGKMVRKGKKVLFYFYSPSCPPCVTMSETINELMQEHQNIFKIDVSQNLKVARSFGVMGTPSLVLVDNQKIVHFKMGLHNREAVEKLLSQ